MNRDLQKEVYRIADSLGIKLSEEDPKNSYLFDGEVIRIGGLSIPNQLHELAHWQVADPEMRCERDFGLGPGPETKIRFASKVPLDEGELQEQEASLLGIAYEAYFGMNFEDTLNLHNWDSGSNSYENFWATISRLTEKGLLEWHMPRHRPKNKGEEKCSI